MKRFRILILAFVAALLGALAYHFYGGGSVPAGQPELVRLDQASFAGFRQEFNAAQDRVRVIVMLSPT